MAKIPFNYYLHDNSSESERFADLSEQDPRFTEELVEDMGRCFYEVMLFCEVDEDTGEVTLLGGQL